MVKKNAAKTLFIKWLETSLKLIPATIFSFAFGENAKTLIP